MKKNLLYLLVLIAVSAGAYFLIKSESGSTIDSDLRSFAVPDTARIGAVFIANRKGESVTVKREGGLWKVNDKYIARHDKIDMVLKTFNRIRIKRPVAKSKLENILKDLASKGVKVELYDLEGNKIQAYIVGGADQKTTGTFMMIEGSRSPFVTHIRGWNGYLSTRFFTEVDDWRTRTLISIQPKDIEKISLNYVKDPKAGFQIQADPEKGGFTFSNLQGEEDASFSKEKLNQYLSGFSKIIAEGFENEAVFKDSLVAKCQPMLYLKVLDKQGNEQNLQFYQKGDFDPSGSVTDIIDNDRHYFFSPETQDAGVVQQKATTRALFRTYNWFK